jgi:hypothetical protein
MAPLGGIGHAQPPVLSLSDEHLYNTESVALLCARTESDSRTRHLTVAGMYVDTLK